MAIRGVLYLAGVLTVACLMVSMAGENNESEPAAIQAPATDTGPELIAAAPPPFSEDIFPCSQCHDSDDEVNTTPRKLEEPHETIVLHHDKGNRWCLACHDAQNRDKLHLANGHLIDFTESYKLCGQCHGPKLRDWKAGAHGKRTGSWSGKKQYLLCANCHDPHSPHFKPLKPQPPPVRPDDLR